MKKFSFAQKCVGVFLLYWLLVAALFWIAGEQFFWRNGQTLSIPESTDGMDPLSGDHVLEQSFYISGDRIDFLAFKSCTYGKENRGELIAELVDESGTALIEQTFDMAALPDNEFVTFSFSEPLEISGAGIYALRLTGSGTVPDQAASVVYNRQGVLPDGILQYDGQMFPGALCIELRQSEALWLGPHYWQAALAGGILLAGYLFVLVRQRKRRRPGLVLKVIDAFQRYSFLLRQLVERDFKTKYKRSVLGILWSFLNPLLTMTVQYIVFSTVFRNDIQNFPVYLLVGVVFFNFFSEACSMGLMSIVGNASLLTKVYIPKYIFPVSRVLSSFVNFLLAFIPLFAVLLFTGQRPTKAFLLLPFSLLCVFVFCMGMVLMLSAMMVFFRDIQFLWGVLTMLWMYATPIFYPETIIPQRFMVLYKMNPLYHFIRFTRLILLDGVSPEPRAYLFCIVAAVVPLMLGTTLFRKTQDRFVLNI